jgi:anti-sigma regulatory factor (Ser/Thr protein kinase)
MIELLRMKVGCDSAAPSTVRQSISRLSELGWALGDVLLVASELVTHAVLHSGCEREDDWLELAVSRVADAVVISALGPGFSGEEGAVRNADDGGLGMVIVDQLARRWGTGRDGGYRVWAELWLPGAHS